MFRVSQFVAVFNQTLELAYPSVVISGELANFRVSKNRWIYFDLKDEQSSLRCFGTVYQLPGPLEDGMMLAVRAQPRLHQLYSFSLNVQALQVSGQGSLKRASDLLAAKLQAEGLFDPERKRTLPYPPQRIGLITSLESAAYVDFTKVLAARWSDIQVDVINTQVQGEVAPEQIIAAINRFNSLAVPPEVIVITRGGGSADDLAAFSKEAVVRAVATSRIPTLVAIGHEVDISLAELAADKQASTPSNAAELLVPDASQVMLSLNEYRMSLSRAAAGLIASHQAALDDWQHRAGARLKNTLDQSLEKLAASQRFLEALGPQNILEKGYAIVRQGGRVVRSQSSINGGEAEIQFADGSTRVIINKS